ncbi:MAG: glycerol-3-phosphate dehydrogenase/oxidase [Acidimicrobiia bacterium]
MLAPSWTRAEHYRRLAAAKSFDVVVIGGGVIGCGVALDLATRGFQVGLVEQADWASGTSGRSTKLFHGGIRYLPHFRFQLVAEGLREQRVLARIADYLFETLEFVVPVYDQHGLADAPAWAARGRRASIALGTGLAIYDLLGGFNRPGERHRRLRLLEVRQAAPLLRTEGLRGAFAYSDAQTDDARLVIALARTAVRHGCTAVSRTQAQRVEAVAGGFLVDVDDVLSGEVHRVRARAVVAATGAFRPPPLDAQPQPQFILSKGVHVILPSQAVGLHRRAIVLPKTDDGRVLFLIPWAGHALVGTTDTAYQDSPARPVATPDDIQYLLEHVRRYLDVNSLSPISTFAGLRALADEDADSTADASREHVITEKQPGYLMVAGGKLTTYRRIAAEVANSVARHLGSKSKSRTKNVLLVGAGRREIPSEQLSRRYGTEGQSVGKILEEVPNGNAVLGDGTTRLGEAGHTVRNESATTIGDFALRRTRLSLLSADHGRGDAKAIASVLGAELGWSASETDRQLAAFGEELEAEGL